MKLTSLRIQNYRGLKDITVPLSSFGCLIGENNSGKSSVLQALLLLLPSPSRKGATSEDFYDTALPIRIELHIEDVVDTDLKRISNAAHRASFSADVVDGAITLVRIIALDAPKSALHIPKMGPANENWTNEHLDPIMTGKRGAELRAAVVAEVPELDAVLPTAPSAVAVRTARDELVLALPAEEKVYRDEPLATGIDGGIKNFLPEPIYIEAVKDVADEVKTTDTATFGKLLSILLDEVKDKFADVEEKFKDIQKQLSRVTDSSGVVTDDRLDEVKTIEHLLNKFVQESFPDVDLKIAVPVPKMKAILSSAEISADDGHEGSILSKGDGLKRAVAFAILRAYTTLRSSGIGPSDGVPKPSSYYWLLFEEPELYLYPRAQKQLFSALEVFSKDHPVMVTTHSPIFFDADSTESFIKFRKIRPDTDQPPFTEVHPIVIDSVPIKTAFQIICHENNNIGFFAKKVVLVEGDSDIVLLRHLAKLLDPKWDSVERNVAFARINGKGNISSYRKFFEKFKIPVHVICDLDTLISGFDHLNPNSDMQAKRGELLTAIDALVVAGDTSEVSEGTAKGIIRSGEARALWAAAKSAAGDLDGSADKLAAFDSAVESFFGYSKKGDRLDVLKSDDQGVKDLKQEVLDLLRPSRSYVLSQGAIEKYYAASSESKDKVKQAIEYCAGCTTLEQFQTDLGDRAEEVERELRLIMKSIFDGEDAMLDVAEVIVAA